MMLENKCKQNTLSVNKILTLLLRWDISLLLFFIISFVVNLILLLVVTLDDRIYVDQFQKVLIQLLLIYLIPLSLVFGGYITISNSVKDALLNITFLPNILILFIWSFIVSLPFLFLELQLIYVEDLTNYINSSIIPFSQTIINIALINFFIRIKNPQATRQEIITLWKHRLHFFEKEEVYESDSSRKYHISQEISKCKIKIQELENET